MKAARRRKSGRDKRARAGEVAEGCRKSSTTEGTEYYGAQGGSGSGQRRLAPAVTLLERGDFGEAS